MSIRIYQENMLEIVSEVDGVDSNINLWDSERDGSPEPVRISINEGYDECFIALTLEEAKAFSEHLNKIIEGLENANKS